MARALNRLAMQRGGPRDAQAIGQALQAAEQLAAALLDNMPENVANWRLKLLASLSKAAS